MYDVKVRGDFIELKAKGETLDEISKVLGVSKRSLNNWNKKYENEIVSAEDNELEVLAQKLKITKGQRLRSFAESIKRVDGELSGRSLKEIPTQSLIVLKIRMMEAVGKALDSTKVEFGTPLTIVEDPYIAVIRACMVGNLDGFSVDELMEELDKRLADGRNGKESTGDDDGK